MVLEPLAPPVAWIWWTHATWGVGGLAHIRYKAAVTETEAVVGADNNQPKGPQQKVAKRFNIYNKLK